MTPGRLDVDTGPPDLETWLTWRAGLPSLPAVEDLKHPAGRRHAMRQALAAAQHGQCALCLVADLDLTMDHNHATGNARGLTCHPCNIREGCAEPGANEVIDAYRANPAAAAVTWPWAYPVPPRPPRALRMGRPRSPERVPLTVRILAETDEQLTAAVEATGKNPQSIVDEALSEYLARLGF